MKQQIIQATQDAKIAATVAGSTTITSVIDLVHGGVSIFAIAAGATLSLTLIIIHWQRWWADRENAKLENKALKLKLELLQRELDNAKKQKEI
ncbi:MAG: hypothetical protein GY804_15365 [Alphaproteobacteria bacterium]|nr:hypothetical protein [Alphaproteobacteria bacterium]